MIGMLFAIWTLHAQTPPAPVHRVPDVCPGATYFYEKHHPAPYWAKKMVVVCVIGDHIFLKPRPTRRRPAS